MRLYSFQVFTAVARYGNLTRASADLHISQPALTQRLKTLERSYNAKLYKKTRGGIELTESGRILLRFAQKILKEHDRVQHKLSDARPAFVDAQSLSVGGSYSPSVGLLPSLLARFRKTHPHVELRLTTSHKKEIQRRLENSQLDIAVIHNPEPSRSLTCEPYSAERLVAFVSPTHRFARRKKIRLQDFGRIPLVIRDGGRDNATTGQILKNLERQGIRCEIAMRCESPHEVKEAVRRNLGLGILFRTTIESDIKKGLFKPIALTGLNAVVQSCILYHKHKPLSPIAQSFLALLRTQRRTSFGRETRHRSAREDRKSCR